MKRFMSLTAALFLVAAALSNANAAIIFDDFNVNEGHFGFAPSFSGQSVGEAASSTADRVTTDGPLEGAGHQKLSLAHDGSATNLRIRHLSGGAPFGSGQAGNPANNVAFTTSAATDGFIGFYAKTTNSGWTIGLNLDDSTAAGAGMDMGAAKPLINDGLWHLYEWNLDDDAQWVAVPSIGGGGGLQHGQHTVDSIYIFANQTGTNGQVRDPLYIDFVAKSDSGSIAGLLNAAPVVNPQPAEGNPNTTQGDIITTTFTATDSTALPVAFSNAVLSTFVPLIPGATNPTFNGTVDAAGNFTWDTTGFARGTYTIDVTATDSGSPALSGTGGGFQVTIENVPEPTSLALCGLSLLGAAVLGRRRVS
jgi:hypothetical protein